jgi:hypothetical protein
MTVYVCVELCRCIYIHIHTVCAKKDAKKIPRPIFGLCTTSPAQTRITLGRRARVVASNCGQGAWTAWNFVLWDWFKMIYSDTPENGWLY